jgi:hypothetical protein
MLARSGFVVKSQRGAGISFGMTASRVMVQVNHQQASDDEWAQLVESVRSYADVLIGIVILTPSGKGPDAAQRKQIAAVAEKFSKSFRGVALLTDSLMVRSALTAIRWLNPRGPVAEPFALHDIEGALGFLKLNAEQKIEVRALFRELERPMLAASG